VRKRIALAVLFATTIGCGSTNVASGPRGVYAVDDYGAAHDGTTDDGPAIRAAIADAVKTGGIVAFGPGVYAFADSLVIDASSITLRGIGRADEHDLDSGRGTVLFHRPLSQSTGGTAVRIGYRDAPTRACAIQDLTLRGSTGNTGTLLSMAGVQYCSLERVDLFHNASTAPGNAALLVTCESETAPTTGCWFEQLHVFAAKNEGGEGDAIRIECGSSGYTTDLNFLHVKTNNATPPGKSVRIVKSDGGVNANHRFVSCRFDAKAGATGVLVEAPRCSFLGCTIDNPTGADRLLEFVASGSDGVWIGNVDGTVLDELAGKRSAATIQGTSRAVPKEKAASP
jgi:hypothetical protein